MPRNDDAFPSHPNRDRNLPVSKVPEHTVINNLDSIEDGEDYRKPTSTYVDASGQIVKIYRDGLGAVSTQELFVVGEDTVGTEDLVWTPYNNRIPNGFSESGAAAIGKLPEGDSLTQTAQAREGGWCRAVTVPVGGGETSLNWTGGYRSGAPGGLVKCQPGDEFKFEVWVKGSAAFTNSTTTAFILWENASEVYDGSLGIAAVNVALTTAWQKVTVRGTAPAGAFGAQFYVSNLGVSADAGKILYMDTAGAIMVVKADELAADSIKTANYSEEDGTKGSGFPVGTPLAGAKMDILGNALKVASNNLQLGIYVVKDLLFRLLNFIDGSTSKNGLLVMRGNNDTTVNFGAPNIDNLVLSMPGYYSVGTPLNVFTLSFQSFGGNVASSNMDGMAYAEVAAYNQSSVGANVTLLQTIRVPFGFRTYHAGVFGALDGLMSSTTMVFNKVIYPLANTYPRVLFLVKLVNVYGGSATRWFYPTNTSLTGTLGYQSSTTAPPGGPAVTASYGSGAISGYCPDPNEPIRVYRPAPGASGFSGGYWLDTVFGDVRVGDKVETLNETTGLPQEGTVSFVEVAEDQPKQYTVLSTQLFGQDPIVVTSSLGHRLLKKTVGDFGSVNWLWTRVDALSPGDEVWAESLPARVLKTLPAPTGPVVKVIIDGPHTFFSRGVLQHNAKAT